jgi:signal transduction histidine kinase
MPSDRFRGPQRFRLVFLLTMGVLAGTLAWLSWEVLARDADDRRRAAREDAADRAVVVLERGLAASREQMAALLVAPEDPESLQLGDGAVLIEFDNDEVHAWPERRLAYVPAVPAPSFEFDAPPLADADRLFRGGRHAAAIDVLRRQSESRDPDTAAPALVRLAIYLVSLDRHVEALEAYDRLHALSTPVVAGLPAALTARAGALWANEQQGDRVAVDQAAAALRTDLNSGAWAIDGAAYQDLSEQAERWLGPVAIDQQPAAVADAIALAQATTWLWDAARSSSMPAAGQRSLATAAGPTLVVWSRSGSRLAAFVATARHVRETWLGSDALDVRLTDGAGSVVLSSPGRTSGDPAVRLLSDTALPWTIETFDTPNRTLASVSQPRQRLVIASLAVVLVVLIAGSWFVTRSVARELEVARLQADFVSAVSHEFRTPLTTLCQLSELLERGRVPSEQDRQTYYSLLSRQSNRLRRLVEGLLDFGRLQSGQFELRKQTCDAGELARSTIEEFAASSQGPRDLVSIDSDDAAPVLADRDAVRLALWNLLDNAVKYSSGGSDVRVEVRRDGRVVRIAVHDRGVGIAVREHGRIFEKFARGQAARDNDISGTGIGLATAREIIRAHGGDIVLESVESVGSTFTIMLPAAVSASREAVQPPMEAPNTETRPA